MGPKNFTALVTMAPPTSLEHIEAGRSESFDARWRDGTRAVVKFARDALPNGRRAQRGIPVRSHPKREVAFWRMAQAYGFTDIVPEAVMLTIDGREASAQAWIAAEPLSSYRPELQNREENTNWVLDLKAATRMVPEESWLKLLVLDFVAGARDRHSNNVGIRILLDPASPNRYGLVAWDNAVTFGKTFRFYHQVFHKFGYRDRINFDPVWDAFVAVTDDILRSVLIGLVSDEEVEHACVRRSFLENFPYRVPWKVVSLGTDSVKDFPSYDPLFEQASKKISDLNPILV